MTPDELRHRLWLLKGMYGQLMEEVVERTIPNHTSNWPVDKAVQFSFRMADDHLYRVLFYRRSNFVAVMAKEEKDGFLSFSANGWVMMGHHDSCWRQTIDHIMEKIWDKIIGYQWIRAYDVITLDEAQQLQLRDTIRKGVISWR